MNQASPIASRPFNWWRRPVLVACACSTALLMASCGSSSSSSTTATSAKGATGTDAALIAGAKRVTAWAESAAVLARGPVSGYTNPANWTQIKSFPGPTSAPKPSGHLRVEILSCVKSSACDTAAFAAQKAVQGFGWTGDVIESDGTPQGATSAFSSALAKNPDAIVAVAFPRAEVQAELVQAQQRHIPTIAIADSPPFGGAGEYTAEATAPVELDAAVRAFRMIAETNGHADVAFTDDNEFTDLSGAVALAKRIIDACSGCKSRLVPEQIADASDPVKYTALLKGVIDSDPNLNYLVLAYGTPGLDAAAAAIRESGRPIQLVAAQGDEPVLKAIQAGEVSFTGVLPLEWTGLAAADQLLRWHAHMPFLTVDQMSIGVKIYDKHNVPANAIPNLDPFAHYRAGYAKIWGGG